MLDLRPVGYIVGLIVAVLGATMLIPMGVDWQIGDDQAGLFFRCAALTVMCGGVLALTCANGVTGTLTIRQAFLLTTGTWVLVPLFGCLPFLLAGTGTSFTDSYFEAVSGITTTGSTIFVGLEAMSPGILLWRGLLNWLGGLGIVIVALIFLPMMRVGGMQFFRTEGFDTLGKIRPRLIDIARSVLAVYFGLTVLATVTLMILGLSGLEAAVHAMASIATGGFSTRDASLTNFSPAVQYSLSAFMILGSLPYIRFVQLFNGLPGPLWRDRQVRAYLALVIVSVLMVTVWRLTTAGGAVEPAFRLSLVNLTSVISGTGFFAGPFESWGAFGVMVAFAIGFIGGCTSSSSGALSVFRVQVMFAAIKVQIALIRSPNSIQKIRYDGREVGTEVMDQVMLYTSGYFATLIVLTLLMTLTGVDGTSALFAVWTSIGNIGFGLGAAVAPTGTMVDFPSAAKWLMVLAMLMGRLGLLAFLVILTSRFWQD